ncbi:MAG: serine hydrolase, partial [Acidobacteriota bacterium]|nr:serine hydrolase [Acidobacteriota bacterium]
AYGLGVGVEFKHGERVIWHDGGIEGFNSYLTYLPDRHIAIIVLSNQDGDSADTLAHQLLDLVLAN